MLYRVFCCWLLLNLWPLLVGVSLFTCTCSVYLAGVFVCFCSLLSCLTIITYCHIGGQLGELLASLAARCRVCLPSSLYCILFTARWQINEVYDRSIDWLIDRSINWLIDWSIDWSIDWLIDRLVVRGWMCDSVWTLTALIRFTQPVLVERENPSSRQNTVKEIQRRVASGGAWPQILVFPEGTCTNRSCLISFKPGVWSSLVVLSSLAVTSSLYIPYDIMNYQLTGGWLCLSHKKI